MANISITSTCNKSCCYCFAQEDLQYSIENNTKIYMSNNTFQRALDYHKRSELNEVGLLGVSQQNILSLLPWSVRF